MAIAHLDQSVRFYCQQGIAESTQRTYKAGVKCFHGFCAHVGLHNPLLVSETTLCQFSAFLANQGLAPQMVKMYLAAIRNLQLTLGLPDPWDTSNLPCLKLLLAGIRRVRSRNTTQPVHLRLPITLPILSAIKQLWERSQITHDTIMHWAAATMCFFVFFDLVRSPPHRQLLTQQSILHGGTWRWIAQQEPQSCVCTSNGLSVTSLVQVWTCTLGASTPTYVQWQPCSSRQGDPGPIFRNSRGHPLTKAAFVCAIRRALAELGLPAKQFAGHSFRIGAATAAAQAGLEDSTIQALGRWSSAAFLLYIHTRREQLSHLTSRIAGAQPEELQQAAAVQRHS